MKYKITELKESMKLVDLLRSELDLSSRMVRMLKREKRVHVNGHKLSFNAKLRIGDVIELDMPQEENIFQPEAIPVTVLYEDSEVLVVNKAPFLVVHPTKGHPFGTLANGIAHYMLEKGDHYKIRFANRLDRDTSGAMIVCKSGVSQKRVSDQMQDGTMVKQYLALVEGLVEADQGTIDEPIDRAYEDSVHRIVRPDGVPSVTHYQVVERFQDHTLLLVTLETGRTHQIRVHLKHLGHVIVGDELYGSNHTLINRQALHSYKLIFKTHTGELVEIQAPLMEDMTLVLERLRQS